MIKSIRLLLEYNTYCLWLYNEDGEIIDNEKEFSFVGCPNKEAEQKLRNLFAVADVSFDHLYSEN